jgi:hypothetical protein
MMQWTAPLRYVVAGGSRRGFFRFKGRLLVGVFVASFLLYQLLLSLRIQQQQAVERTIEKDAAKCRTRSRFVYIKMFKTASTTLSNMFKRFGLLHNLTFVLPPKNKIYIGWPYQIDDSFYRPSKSGVAV